MPIRIVDTAARLGSLNTATEGVIAAFPGTHVPPASRTGVMLPQLLGATALLMGVFSPATDRTGVLTPTLAGLTASFQGSVTAPAAGGPVIFYTDLASAPVGAFVTVYGRRFTGTVVSGATVFSRTDTQIVLTWSGNPVTIDSLSVPCTTRAGRVVTCANSTQFASAVSNYVSGDVIYLRAGTYSGSRYGDTFWGDYTLTLGSWANGMSVIGYPGEIVNFGNIRTHNGTTTGDDFTAANLRLSGSLALFSGTWWEAEESGSVAGRVVNCDCFGSYGSQNTLAGIVQFGADNWKVYGCKFTNNAPSPINNNHAVYCNVGGDFCEIAWCTFGTAAGGTLRLGHVIQLHTDGPLRTYTGTSIHDNFLAAANAQDMRGINFSGQANDSTGTVYNNILLNVGQSFSGININSGGTYTVFHNTLYNISGPCLTNGAVSLTARNNIFIGGSVSATVQSNNVTTGTVDANGRYVGTLPTCPNVGVPLDFAGNLRPGTCHVGAYES